MLNRVISDGGSYDEYTNILIREVTVPSSIAETSTQVRNVAINAQVTNLIRLELASSFTQVLQRQWEKVVEKIILKVEAKFVDGSSATYGYSYMWESYNPFVLQENSIRDTNGKLVSNSMNNSGGGGTEGIRYSSRESIGGSGGLYQQCANYTTWHGAFSWSGRVCWYTRTP